MPSTTRVLMAQVFTIARPRAVAWRGLVLSKRASVPEAVVSPSLYPEAIGQRMYGRFYEGGSGETQSGACSAWPVGRQSNASGASVPENTGLGATWVLGPLAPFPDPGLAFAARVREKKTQV